MSEQYKKMKEKTYEKGYEQGKFDAEIEGAISTEVQLTTGQFALVQMLIRILQSSATTDEHVTNISAVLELYAEKIEVGK